MIGALGNVSVLPSSYEEVASSAVDAGSFVGPHRDLDATAGDGETIVLWNLVAAPDERWHVPGLLGPCFVELAPSARAKTVLRELPGLLGELETQGVTQLDVGCRRRHLTDAEQTASRLAVNRPGQGATDFPGSIYVTIDQPLERTGEILPTTTQPLAYRVVTFLADRSCADVRAKLLRSRALEWHAFVLVPEFTTAPP